MSEVVKSIRRRAAAHPDSEAIRDERDLLTWSELVREIDCRMDELRRSGVRRLVLTGDNSSAWLVWDLAALAAGVATIPLPPFFSAEQRAHLLDACGADGIVLDGSLELRAGNRAEDWPEDTAKVTFTSGTTGRPKGVCLTRAALERVAMAVAAATAPMELDRHLCALPLSVLLENIAGCYAALLRGLALSLPGASARGLTGAAQIDGARLAEAIDREQAGSVILVPEMLKQLTAASRAAGRAPTSLRLAAVGGARVGAGLIDSARAAGIPAYEGYGLSECASVISLNLPCRDRPGSAGVPLGHARLRVRNGLVEAHSPGFLGYLGGPAAPGDGWVRTDDQGRIEDGMLWLDGRRGHVFVTAFGRNVCPEWPECELLAEPAIVQALVHGEALETPRALLYADSAVTDTRLGAAVAAANRRLPDYARIGRWLRLPVPAGPDNGLATATGKLRRQRLIGRHADFFDDSLHKEPA